MKKRSDSCLCDALKANGERCRSYFSWTLPNVLSGTGKGVNDWVYGKSIRLCRRHANPFLNNQTPVRLIEGGFLQPYNHHGYGNVVLSEIIDWSTFNKDKKYTVPEYWKKIQEGNK